MPPRHISVKRVYASGALKGSAGAWQYAPMAKRPLYVKQWRKYRGLTQAQLAERIGIDQGHLSKIENRKRQYDEGFLEAVADELRCNVPDLLMRDPTDTEAIWSIWEGLAPVQRRQVIEMAKVIKGTGTDG